MRLKLYLLTWFLPVLLLFSFVSGDDGSEDNPAVVTIKQGKLQGVPLESRKGNKYYGFLGVSYARAPVRFGLPQPPVSWEGTKMATKLAPQCFQFCLIAEKLSGVEDCLTMNIYTRKLPGKKVPVMVLIHGGGFQIGTGSFSHAKYFMDEEVILITIQYRLGALGFLNTEDDVVPGNMGLKDQSAALKWIQENIESFGGDPKKVSIFGYSAGGASVHYHVLSPMSKGLFSTAISQSGSALNPWAQQTKPKDLAIRLGDSLGCSHETTQKLVECLRSKTPAEIVNAQLKFSKFPHEFDLISMLFSPSVERGQSEPKFLPDTSYNLMMNGKSGSKVPWMIGVTEEEGGFYIAPIMEDEKSVQKINSDWYKMAPNILYYETTCPSPATQSKVSRKIWDFYFGEKKISHDNYLDFGRVLGDRFFVTGVARAIKEHARKPDFPVYPYIFSYESSHSIQQGFLRSKRTYGVGHADDLKFLFNKTYGAPEFTLDTKDGKLSENLIKLFVSFANDGKPTSTWGSAEWEPFVLTEENEKESPIPWYVIDEEPKVLTEDPFKKRTDFWESLPFREVGKEEFDFPEEKDEL